MFPHAWKRHRKKAWFAGGLIVLALIAWWRWPSAVVDAPPATAVQASPDGRLVLTEDQMRGLDIASDAVTAASIVPLPGLPASSAAPLAASTHVVVPYTGVVTRILVDEGADVQAGQALARVQSRDLLLAQADLARARSEAIAASAQARRDRALLAEGIIAAAREEQSRARASAADGTLQQARGALTRLRIASDGAPGEYELLAPMSGRVLRRQVQPGQAVAALDAAFVVAAGRQVDMDFAAPVALRPALATGTGVRLPDGSLARIVAVGADVDPASQTVRVRAQAEDGAYIAGQRLTVSLQLPAPAGSVAVPTRALLSEGHGHVLYRLQGRTVSRIAVQDLLGGDERISVVHAEGLKPGDQVVIRGTVTLKGLLPATDAQAAAQPTQGP